MAFTVEEASARILAGVQPLPAETVRLADALGRVLAREVRSPIAHPPWDNSSMDGYAVRSADVLGATAAQPIVLPVLETVRAGQRAAICCLHTVAGHQRSGRLHAHYVASGGIHPD